MKTEQLRKLADGIDRFSDRTGKLIAWLTLGIVLITFAVVVLRYTFNLGWIAMQESVTYLHAAVFMLGAAYTLRHDGHVRVDVLYQKCSPCAQAWSNLLGTLLLLLPVCIYILWSSWDYVMASWALKESSQEAGGLPAVFILKTAIPVMAILLIVQGFSQALRSVLVLMGGAVDSGRQP